MIKRICFIFLFLFAIGVVQCTAEEKKAPADFRINLELVKKPGKIYKTLVLQVELKGEKSKDAGLVFPPISRGATEGWDLLFDVIVDFGPGNIRNFTKQELIYRSSTTLAYRILTEKDGMEGLVVISDGVGKIYFNNFQMTNAKRKYTVYVKYHTMHEKLLEYFKAKQSWVISEKLKIEIEKPSNP